jgi:hypothetical protein
MEDYKTSLEKMKPSELRALAQSSSSSAFPYKRTIHGKNKTTLIEYLLNHKIPSSDQDLRSRLHQMKKPELITLCKRYLDYKTSFSRRGMNFHIDFLIEKKVDLDKNIPDDKTTDDLRDWLKHKKAVLVQEARKIPGFQSSMEKQNKEFMARFLVQHSHKPDQLSTKNPPIVSEKVKKSTIIPKVTTTVDTDPSESASEDGYYSPVRIQQFLEVPDEKELQAALIKILTTTENI